MNDITSLPVAVIGAGPIGLAAAAHLLERGLTPIVLERGAKVGSAVAEWGHVRVFSPWRYNIDRAAKALLLDMGWHEPDPDALPTGAEIVRDYLLPLAAHPHIAPTLHLSARVEAVTRLDGNKLASQDREGKPFTIHWRDASGQQRRSMARAVIDASGTWGQPSPIGLDGLPVPGELENADKIAYGIPDVSGAQRSTYANRHTLVIGAGHSAINAALDLMDLQQSAPDTRISWATRGGGITRLLGGGLKDELPGRGQLGLAAAQAANSGRLSLLSPFAARRISRDGERVVVHAEVEGKARELTIDRIIVATGLRPDLSLARELRLTLDPIVETTPALAPLVDPNLHSCGTVYPHGVEELAHPEKDFFIVGMKSYGRAPTFLMVTGYEQVRSVVAELAGDAKAAREVALVLPETGVCRIEPATADPQSCCGTSQNRRTQGGEPIAQACGCGPEPHQPG